MGFKRYNKVENHSNPALLKHILKSQIYYTISLYSCASIIITFFCVDVQQKDAHKYVVWEKIKDTMRIVTAHEEALMLVLLNAT